VTALVESYNGAVVERYMYDPYGKATILNGVIDSTGNGTTQWTLRSTNTFQNAILYCGYYFDDETGLYSVRHRYYHPSLGRWLSRDPIGYSDGMSLYEYVGSSPILRLDAYGLFFFLPGCSPSEEPKEKPKERKCCCTKLVVESLFFSRTMRGRPDLVGGSLIVQYVATGTGDDVTKCDFVRTVQDYVWSTEKGKKVVDVQDKAPKPDGPLTHPNKAKEKWTGEISSSGKAWSYKDLDGPGLWLQPRYHPGRKEAIYRFYVVDSDGQINPDCDKTWTLTVDIDQQGNVTYTPVHGAKPNVPFEIGGPTPKKEEADKAKERTK